MKADVKHKKMILAISLAMIMMVGIPVMQSLLFSYHSKGRISREVSLEAHFLDPIPAEIVLVYFGYVGCIEVCTPLLDELARFYDAYDLSTLPSRVRVIFVNLTPGIGTEQPDQFAKAFHPSFQGIYLDRRQLMELDRHFGVYYTQKPDQPEALNHSDNIYLLSKAQDGRYRLHSVYATHPLNEELLVEEIKTRLEQREQ